MTKAEFRSYIKEGPIFLDGATGSNLMKRGMPFGVCPEAWVLEHPEVLQELQREYVRSGSKIVYAPTFTANRIKLKEYGLEKQLSKMNRELVRISKEAVGEAALVAGDITMTGEPLAPMGSLTFEDLVEVYEEQLSCLAEAGCDLFVVETMMSLQETRAALIAAKKWPDMPIMATMTFDENGRTLYGTDAKTALLALQSLGADAAGINCSAGPDKMLPLIRTMAEYAIVPLIAKPNAGMPKMGKDGQTDYDMDMETFASFGPELFEAGAHILGGCCGTSPEYIGKTKTKLEQEGKKRILEEKEDTVKALTNERNTYFVEEHWTFGKSITLENTELKEELLDGDTDTLLDLLDEEMDEEVDALLITAAEGGEEARTCLLKIAEELARSASLPLIFAVEDEAALEAVLRNYGGIAGVKAESAGAKAVAKRYGAVLIECLSRIIRTS